jgi:hypothetical protein
VSALGQKRTCASQQVMSALLPKADICGALTHVCFGPKADIDILFDHLVGNQQKVAGNRQAECFGRLQIDC